jgi:hypothetical protein
MAYLKPPSGHYPVRLQADDANILRRLFRPSRSDLPEDGVRTPTQPPPWHRLREL